MKAEYHNNTLCLQANWLWDMGIISKSNYDMLVYRERLKVVRPGKGLGNPALIEWQSMPERFKNAVLKFGDPVKMTLKNTLVKNICTDTKAERFFEEYRLADGRRLKPEIQAEYYTNAIILNAINTIINNKKALKGALGGRAKKIWENLANKIAELDTTEYPHSLPTNERRLKERYDRYKAEGYQSLVHKSFGNKNSAKVDTDVKESVMIELISDPRNLDNAQIARLYNMMAESVEWKKITASAVGVWRDKLDLESKPGRRGLSNFRNTSTMQVKRTKPTSPLYYWTMDGWDAELLYQETKVDSKGNSVTTYHNRLTIVVVLDPCLNYPVGYAIGTHETPELITEALRNAANHTAELFGQRHRTHQLQSDHYSIKSLTPVYEAIAKHFTPAQVKNAKAKIVEPYFKYLNKKYCQLMPNWSGFGVTAKKDNQPNVDFLNKYKHSFPDQNGCRLQLERMMMAERAEKQARYMELYGKMPENERLTLSNEEYLYYFGAVRYDRTGKIVKNSLAGPGVIATIGGMEYTYDCFDLNFRSHAAEKWILRHDPENLSQVLATNEDGTLRFMLQEKHNQPMALIERQEEDAPQLQAVRDFNAGLEEHITEVRSQSIQKVQELFANTPELNDTLAKMVLVDSRGQHKNPRNNQRLLQQAEKVNKKALVIEEKQEENNFTTERQNYIREKIDLTKYLQEA